MPQSKRYLDYFKTIPSDTWHPVSKYAPENPMRFLEYLKQLPKEGREIEPLKMEFKINGKL